MAVQPTKLPLPAIFYGLFTSHLITWIKVWVGIILLEAIHTFRLYPDLAHDFSHFTATFSGFRLAVSVDLRVHRVPSVFLCTNGAPMIGVWRIPGW